MRYLTSKEAKVGFKSFRQPCLIAVLCTSCGSVETRDQRPTVDRPDDSPKRQVHLMYVLPKDGTDEYLDTLGTIRGSVAAFQKWFARESGGRQVRIDTYRGDLDITFVQLSSSDAEIRNEGDWVRDYIEKKLKDAGFKAENKIYAVYYGGSHTKCADGPNPASTPSGSAVALYLKGIPTNGSPPCASNGFASDPDHPGYWEFSMLHEIFHAMGAVGDCAPNHFEAGHVNDDPHDLMYRGTERWGDPWVLDEKRDDYYGHKVPGCVDIAKSPYLR